MAEARRRAESIERQKSAKIDESVQRMVADPLIWMQQHTRTFDKHWLNIRCATCGAPEKERCPHKQAFKPFPRKDYFRHVLKYFQTRDILFAEKSRDMMMSWLFVGCLTHEAMTIEGMEVLFQSQKEDKAAELIEYSRILWRESEAPIRQAFPLVKDDVMRLDFANRSRIIGIPHGADQIRSYHATALLQDEAAHTPDAGESFAAAIAACPRIYVLSSAGPGWFGEQCESAV